MFCTPADGDVHFHDSCNDCAVDSIYGECSKFETEGFFSAACARYGMEQYHYGIVGTDGVTVTPGGREYEQFIKEIGMLRKKAHSRETKPEDYLARKTAILFNHENSWNIEKQKQNYTWETFDHVGKYYCALKSFGAPVDFISENKDFTEYPVIVVPAYQLADKELVGRWEEYARNLSPSWA